MTYQALYRKYRPADFASLVGQDHIQKILRHAVAQERMVHAYLFCGPRGTGKTSTAKILAKAVNCLDNRDGEPCGVCAACVRIGQGLSLDILEIDAASNRGIDEVRDLRERVKYAPAQERYKVYIIDEVHMLTNEAFNALLKTLEEPPGHVIFILATTEPHKVPLTVLSRCQRLDFRRISDADIEGKLRDVAEKEGIAISDEALALIAKQAQGGLRDAIGLLDQAGGSGAGKVDLRLVQDLIGAVDTETVTQMAAWLCQNDIVALLTGVRDMLSAGRDLRQFLQELLIYLRELLLYLLGSGQGEKPAGWDRLTETGAGVPSAARLLAMWEVLAPADREMKQSLNPRIFLELALMRAAAGLPAANTASCGSTPAADTASLPAAGPGIPGSAGPTPAASQQTREVPPQAAQPAAVPPPASKAVQRTATPPLAPQATQPATPANGAVNLDAVLAVWPKVLQQMKTTAVTTHAFLREGKPVRLAGNRLVLAYPDRLALHMEQICQNDLHKNRLRDALEKSLGVRLDVSGELGDIAQTPAASSAGASVAGLKLSSVPAQATPFVTDVPLPEPPPAEADLPDLAQAVEELFGLKPQVVSPIADAVKSPKKKKTLDDEDLPW